MAHDRSRPISTVYLDTGGLWALDALLFPEKFSDPRAAEYLALVADAAVDPRRELHVVLPSEERKNGPLPTFYSSLIKAGLVTAVTPLAASNLITSPSILAPQFAEFQIHLRVNRPALHFWTQLQTHPDVVPGGLIGVPEQSSKWKIVPEFIADYLSSNHEADLLAIQNSYSWSAHRTALTFSLVQRAHAYAAHAAMRNAEYITHPTRWLVLPADSPRPPDPTFGVAVGGLIVKSIESGALQPNADRICEFIASLRIRLAEELTQLWSVRTTEQARDLILPLLPGILGGKLTSGFDKFVRGATEIALTSIGALAGAPPALAWVASKLVVGPMPLVVSEGEAVLFRRWVDYPSLLQLTTKTCAYDGAFFTAPACPVCTTRAESAGA